MAPTSRSKLRIAIVTTRNLAERNGRTPIIAHIIVALGRSHEIELLRLRSVIEIGRLQAVIGAAFAWLASLIRWRPMPLQCVLYAAPSECAALARRIRDLDCDCVYLDTVRCQTLLRRLRRLCPDLHIVTDFDDLMSRRAAYLSRNRLPFAPGHVAQHFPPWLVYLVEAPLARLLTAYEAATLPGAEDEVIGRSAVTILLSPVDRDLVRRRQKPPGGGSLHFVMPAVRVQRSAWSSAASLRFVFIGSDSYLQNRTAIELLLRTWSQQKLSTPLHIYGRQTLSWASPGSVHWNGFVADLSEVYQPGSIALVPALDRGGIKTKVLEAWAWGCPVLGNPAALEGLSIEHYPLVLPEAGWAPLLANPADYIETWADAARRGSAFVQTLGDGRFERAWDMLMQPRLRGAEAFEFPVGGVEPALR